MKDMIGKWRVTLSCYKRLEYMDGRRTFVFGIYKMKSWPPENVHISKENYDGFIWQFTFLIKRGW